MLKNASAVKSDKTLNLEQIKRIAVTAMFADNELFETLVLKGGNALSLIHKLGSRSSLDLDFSMQHDLKEDVGQFCERVERTLKKTFLMNGYTVFDVSMDVQPKAISKDLADFWGGYNVAFKLIATPQYEIFKDNLENLRKRAVSIGQKKKFLIDVSRFEYTIGKQEADLDGYRIYVYSPQMIVCEKLRAICQQMPDYGVIVKRDRAGTARARDFIDIHVLVTTLALNLTEQATMEIISGMFQVKKVPLSFLGVIQNYREFHRADYPSVQATVSAGAELQDFDFYFDFVLDLVVKLKPLWHE